MAETKLEDVFGVSKEQVLSYIERPAVDGAFTEGLKSDKQIIVYGASKQGKTALVSKYLPYGENIVVNCSPKSQATDIYKSILRCANIQVETQTQSSTEVGGGVSIKTKFKAMLPFLGSTETELEANGDIKRISQRTNEAIEFNLELPHDVCELLKSVKSSKFVILENFHYLEDDVQRQLAFDLRTFQEIGLRFIVLGVWREKTDWHSIMEICSIE